MENLQIDQNFKIEDENEKNIIDILLSNKNEELMIKVNENGAMKFYDIKEKT